MDTALPVTQSDLPLATSPTLRLLPATEKQIYQCWEMNASSWRGALSHEAYVRREKHLGSQSLTQDGGATYWILVDTENKSTSPRILASCETYRRRAIVATRPSDVSAEVKTIVSHGIGSVYCETSLRGNGYAGRMMEELRKILETWQQPGGSKATFNVLFSDIGREFYARRGWIPHPSTYLSLLPTSLPPKVDLPKVRPIFVNDLHELCEADERHVKMQMVDFSTSSAKARVACAPDFDTFQWMHAREEFVGKELGKPELDVKGVIVDQEAGRRTWCVWTRKFDDDAAERTLHVARLVSEGERHFQAADKWQVLRIASCLKAAQHEAARLGLAQVEIWNPAPCTIEAAKLLQDEVIVREREQESIASLLWYGPEIIPGEVEWFGSEKYCWC